jgi:hypothetical protein
MATSGSAEVKPKALAGPGAAGAGWVLCRLVSLVLSKIILKRRALTREPSINLSPRWRKDLQEWATVMGGLWQCVAIVDVLYWLHMRWTNLNSLTIDSVPQLSLSMLLGCGVKSGVFLHATPLYNPCILHIFSTATPSCASKLNLQWSGFTRSAGAVPQVAFPSRSRA